MSSISRKVAWTMVVTTGAYAFLSGGRYAVGRTIVYWAFIAASETAAPFALLCIALTAALLVRFFSTRREQQPDGFLPVALAALSTFVAILRAFAGGLSHGGSVELDGRTYHLAFDVPLDRDDRCILFECSSPNVLCVSRLVVTRYLAASNATLQVGDQPHTISMYAGKDSIASYSTSAR